MGVIPTLIVLAFTATTLILTFLRYRIYWFLGVSLIVSQLFCVYDILTREPAQIFWLCNVAVFLNIFLLFKFNQTVFNLFFYFSWLGCFFICLMPINAYSLMIKDLPLIWIAYWIKHLVPLIMSFYFIRVEGWRLSRWSYYYGVVGFLCYSFVTYFYNLAFGQNILYLNEPAPFMEPMGRYYFWVAVPLGYFWVGILYSLILFFGGVKKSKSESEELQIVSVENQSIEGS